MDDFYRELQLDTVMFDRFSALDRELREHAAEWEIEVSRSRIDYANDDQPHREAHDAGYGESVKRFYRSCDGFELRWESTRCVTGDDCAVGRVRILGLEGVLSDEWPTVMYDGAGSPDLRDVHVYGGGSGHEAATLRLVARDAPVRLGAEVIGAYGHQALVPSPGRR